MRPSLDLLQAVNWDFPTSLPGVGTSLHWYPGTFPNALPATLIQAFTRPGATVFDPYGGIGTTGFEAVRQERNAIVVDANPVAATVSLFSCVLVTMQRLAPMYVAATLEELGATVAQGDRVKQSILALPAVESIELGAASKHLKSINNQIERLLDQCVAGDPQISALAPWFHERTLKELLSLYRSVTSSEHSPFLRLAGLVMISAVLRPSSSQTASWGHVADNVLPKDFKYKSVYLQCKLWLGKIGRVLRDIEIRPWDKGRIETSAVFRFNWLHEPTPDIRRFAGAVDLMVTSPPYASAIDYTLSQRLSQYLFGFSDNEIMSLVNEEIGARRKRFHSAPEEIWATHLASSLESQLVLMKEDGVICVILPHKDAGRHLGEAAFEVTMKGFGWRPIWSGSRSIRQSRTRQSWTSIQKEALLIFGGRGS